MTVEYTATTTEEDRLVNDATFVRFNTTIDRGRAEVAANDSELRGWDDKDTEATEPVTDDSDTDAELRCPPIRILYMVLPWGRSK